MSQSARDPLAEHVRHSTDLPTDAFRRSGSRPETQPVMSRRPRVGASRWRTAAAAALLVPALVACKPLLEDFVAEYGDRPVAQTTGPSASATVPAVAPSTAGATDSAAAPATSTAAPQPPPSAAVPEATPAAEVVRLPGASDNPLAGAVFYGPNPGASLAAEQLQGSNPDGAALLRTLAEVPTARWLGEWSGDITTTARTVVQSAAAAGAVPILVAYNIPGRGCDGYSAGGERTPEGYARWIQGLANGIGTAEAIVVVEPDALAQMCGDEATILRMLASAVDVLEANPGTYTYIDAGNSGWIDAATTVERLRAAGVASADGFSLNVSNFKTTADELAYGRALSAELDGAHFVIDTSRNGNGPGNDWCNPAGRAVGERPTARTGDPVVDAFLWIKVPGESDGTCNGGPAAGTFWPDYAIGLARG